MKRITALAVVIALQSLALPAHGADTAAEPFVFTPVTPAPLARLPQADDVDSIFLTELSIAGSGDYVALSGAPIPVQIWSLPSGKRTALLDPLNGMKWRIHAALVGKPCVAVTGIGLSREPITKRSARPLARPMELWDCASGNRIGSVAATANPRGSLYKLLAVPSCDLVVARYSDRVTVIDVKAQTAVHRLNRLFDTFIDETRASAPRGKKLTTDASPAVAVVPGDERCRVYAAVSEYSARSVSWVPSKIYEVDLRAGTSRLLRRIADTRVAPPGIALLAISPSGARAVLSTSRHRSSNAEFNLIDLHGAQPTRKTEYALELSDVQFLSEDHVYFTSWFGAAHADGTVLDPAKGRFHTVCANVVGAANLVRGKPRAFALDASLNLFAIATQDDVRVLRYRYVPTGAWRGLFDCDED